MINGSGSRAGRKRQLCSATLPINKAPVDWRFPRSVSPPATDLMGVKPTDVPHPLPLSKTWVTSYRCGSRPHAFRNSGDL
jgi:hypothetical protein